MGTVMQTQRKPHLHLCECDLSEIKDWKVGEKYTLTLEVEMTGLHKNEMPMMEKNEDMLEADFEVESITPKGGKTVSTEDEEPEEKEETEDESKPKETPEVAQAVKRKLLKEEE